MLTYSSDLLPQIVCPMDEDAIPPNPFCSAPPHSEPPPPLLPLSSITPSCVRDEILGNRRRGRIQGIRGQASEKQSDAVHHTARKPSRQNPSPTKRQREIGNMVQVSQSQQQRVEGTHAHEKRDGLHFSSVEECHTTQNDLKTPKKNPDDFVTEHLVEHFAETSAQSLDATKTDMDAYKGLAVEDASPQKGWVIGPLFQSFKSKMASFTEIVFSPVKLFRSNSPPPSMDCPHKLDEIELQADGRSGVKSSEPGNMFPPQGQSEYGNEGKINQKSSSSRVSLCAGGEQNGAFPVYSRKLTFDDEFEIPQNDKNPVPLQHNPLPCIVSEEISEPVGSVTASSVLLPPSVDTSASQESMLKMSSVVEEQKGKRPARVKPPPRKRTGNRSGLKRAEVKSHLEASDEQLSRLNTVKSNTADSRDIDKTLSTCSSVCYTEPNADWLHDGVDDSSKTESGPLVRQGLRRNFKNEANEGMLDLSMDTRHLDHPLNSETYRTTGSGRAKRLVKPDCRSQDLVKRKRLKADVCKEDTKNGDLYVASDSVLLKGLRPALRKDVVAMDTFSDKEQTLRPARTKQAVSTRANSKGKAGQVMLAALNEKVLHMQTDCASDVMSVCSLDEGGENNQKSSSKAKPSGRCKRLKSRTGPGRADVDAEDRMDVETTVGIATVKQDKPEKLPEAFFHLSEKDPLQRLGRSSNLNKKPRKQKSLIHAATNSDSTLVSTSSELLELTAAGFNTSHRDESEESWDTGMPQPTKRPKKDCRSSLKFSVAGGTEETQACNENFHLQTKPSQNISTDPVYFEMTPFESNPEPGSNCSVNLNQFANDMDGKHTSRTPTGPEAGDQTSIKVSRLRRVNLRPRRTDKQRRKCRVLHNRTHTGEEMANSITMEDPGLTTTDACSSESRFSRRLSRSYSCPEIPAFHPQDMPWTHTLHSPQHSRIHTSHQSTRSASVHQTPKSLQRTRRHTVSSVEVEREIAPLCLRKEVYPTRRSAPCDGATQHMSQSLTFSPGTSFSALASGFISSPQAFLSKKADSRVSAASPSTSTHVSSPISSSSTSPLSSSTWHRPGFFQKTDSSAATLDPSSSRSPFECKIERRQQSEEEDDGEDTGSSSQEFEDLGLREEKALSDSEIKVPKHEERGKVSSIRIRKTLPKPQNNLTPMGLPKAIRLKKKEFSLEEIYTNKNFSKPPESRLETIFEVPFSRRNGSESWFGQKRVKRFLEFLEVGEARKPKKPLVGVGKAGFSSSRTRRGAFPKDEPSLTVQDVDSLLCTKLDQLNLWLMQDQEDS